MHSWVGPPSVALHACKHDVDADGLAADGLTTSRVVVVRHPLASATKAMAAGKTPQRGVGRSSRTPQRRVPGREQAKASETSNVEDSNIDSERSKHGQVGGRGGARFTAKCSVVLMFAG